MPTNSLGQVKGLWGLGARLPELSRTANRIQPLDQGCSAPPLVQLHPRRRPLHGRKRLSPLWMLVFFGGETKLEGPPIRQFGPIYRVVSGTVQLHVQF